MTLFHIVHCEGTDEKDSGATTALDQVRELRGPVALKSKEIRLESFLIAMPYKK